MVDDYGIAIIELQPGTRLFYPEVRIYGYGAGRDEADVAPLAPTNRIAGACEGIEYELTKITDINEIMAFGVMMTPALVVDGDVKVVGRVPGVETIRGMLA